ncbi:uncharacterized protein LOC126630833 [Malus sylvestris]|uniref:Uncharacterized protein n=1 Tax=Malus domestica TaxID=3750 RepID=A0A498KP90_MALDO|nr:uncharacterized protein LOC108172417 [Malus domestica]XP_050157011.1 uncharacterized protein LOC126630833 [Malus sylvestris]XP_050157064.1 uncharacterized protein LOC126630833 [Malus sylvestris]RXI09407.1 hypothetical protein DVH24_034024 [Malus domestica]
MCNFGDEFTIESYRIPWLVWIQVMVMVLLLIILYCFSLLVIDLSNDDITTTTTTTKPSSSTSRLVSDGTATSTTLVTNRLQNSQVGESIKGEIVTSTSRTMRREEMVEMEEASAAVAAHIYFHPCYYFRLARIAFLKCLGFDCTFESSSTP